MKNTNKRTSVPSHRRVCSHHYYETLVSTWQRHRGMIAQRTSALFKRHTK